MASKDLRQVLIVENKDIRIVAFVGPSGTGKSHRAQMVAKNKGINYIIDDAILIHDNKLIAGTSAKRANTKIESVKRALFSFEGQAEEMKNAIRDKKPDAILILGTSDDMVNKIVKNLDLPPISETVYIQDVSSPQEMELAKSIRMSEGKYVIPVPTFEIKKDFSGYLLDPLQIFKWKGKGTTPFMTEKSIIRPTFSYLGKYIISDNVLRAIVEYASKDIDGIYKIQKTNLICLFLFLILLILLYFLLLSPAFLLYSLFCLILLFYKIYCFLLYLFWFYLFLILSMLFC